MAINRAARHDDEWFDEPDDLDRVRSALAAIEAIEDPVAAAAVLASGTLALRDSLRATSERRFSWLAGFSITTASTAPV